MTKDDKLLRETVLAELKRRRVLSGEPLTSAQRAPTDEPRAARPEAARVESQRPQHPTGQR
jgi:hypothetical protein